MQSVGNAENVILNAKSVLLFQCARHVKLISFCIKLIAYKNALLELSQILNFEYVKIVLLTVGLAMVQKNLNVLVVI